MKGDKRIGNVRGTEPKENKGTAEGEKADRASESQVLQSFTQGKPHLLDHIQILTLPFKALNQEFIITHSPLLADNCKISILYTDTCCQEPISTYWMFCLSYLSILSQTHPLPILQGHTTLMQTKPKNLTPSNS